MPNDLIFGMFFCVGMLFKLLGAMLLNTRDKESTLYVFGIMSDCVAKVALVASGIALYFSLLKL